MSTKYYELYQEKSMELSKLIEEYGSDFQGSKKLHGALAAELLRQELGRYLEEHKKPIKVSQVNAYITGSKYEYDLLLVKDTAESYMGLVYRPEDVIAIIESKALGLFDVDKDTDSIAKAVNHALNLNRDIRFGYITLSENVPAKEYNAKGNPTVKHWDLTKKYLSEKIEGECSIYAVTLYQGKNLYDEGNESEFEEFVENIINQVE